jgi:hypothetical protein
VDADDRPEAKSARRASNLAGSGAEISVLCFEGRTEDGRLVGFGVLSICLGGIAALALRAFGDFSVSVGSCRVWCAVCPTPLL